MLGIIGAMDKETEKLFARMTDTEEFTCGYSRFTKGLLEGVPCVVARCGIGKVHAAVCAQIMLIKYPVTAVLNIGVAGALDDTLKIADCVIASGEVQHDIDTSPIGDPVGLISGPNIIEVPCDTALTARLQQAAEALSMHTLTAAIATGDQFICGAERKRALGKAFNAAACDMEGGAIAQVCYENQIPYAAYRTISDTVEDSGTAYFINAQHAADQSVRLLEYFLQHYQEA